VSTPRVLGNAGVGAALKSVSWRAAIPIAIDDRWRRRHAQDVELAVYFCCLEALQNVAKHAGAGATATVRLTDEAGRPRFMIEDDGVGFDARHVERGAGLDNIADCVSACGGVVSIDSAPGRGTRISGLMPA
jgi:signal transduction histidine kinase